MLLHGETKIGKTSLLSCYPDPFFLFTEPSGSGLRVRNRLVENWPQFRKYVNLIRDSDKYGTIILDTVQLSYKMAFATVCNEKGVDHPSEGSYGDVWEAISTEWCTQMLRLMRICRSTGRGIVFVSHSTTGTFQSRTGEAYNKIVPSMDKNAFAFMKEKCDIIGYYGYFGKDRYLTIAGSDELEAGHRLRYQFRTTDGGRVHSIPMYEDGYTEFGEEDAYANLEAAFNNLQEWSGEPEVLRSVLADTKVKQQSRNKPRR